MGLSNYPDGMDWGHTMITMTLPLSVVIGQVILAIVGVNTILEKENNI